MIKEQRESLRLNTVGSQGVRSLFFIGLILLIFSGYFWWRQVVNSPRNVFYGMVSNSLKTLAVSRHTVQQSGAQTLDQITASQSSQPKVAESNSVLSQQSKQSAAVKTESIGTPTEDFVRYLSIDTGQVSKSGKPLDFTEVLGVWGRTASATGQTTGELYGESMLGLVPMGYVPANEREEILDLIKQKDIYAPDLTNVERKVINGRPVYTYTVEITPENYVGMLKKFAAAVGLTQLESLESENFAGSPSIQFRLSVDVWSRQLIKTEFVGSMREEHFSAYGAKVDASVPENYITVDELQGRLQSIQ